MSNRNRFLIISLLLVFIIWGVFIFRHWQKITFRPIGEDLKRDLKTEEKERISEGQQKVEKAQLKESIQPQELIEKTQEIIEKSKELISKTQKFIETEIAKERSSRVKGIYMTEFIANSKTLGAVDIREDIKDLLAETELNGIVIDIKEASGPNLSDSLKRLIEKFRQTNIWTIARICAFRDSSLIKEKPNWYLKREITTTTNGITTTTLELWQDPAGEYWLDPASLEVQDYIIEFSKKAIDFGFDELQFDYIRFPSEGDLENIFYPVYNQTKKEKTEVIGEFFSKLSKTLKSYKLSIILSVDLFGYVATQYQALGIGQRLEDTIGNFDYISFMLYPSHFYGGFRVGEDLKRKLPPLYFPYESEDIKQVVSNHPYEVVLRSIFSAKDFFSGFQNQPKIRPWLQDFNLKVDTDREIYYDVKKVRAQIEAAEAAGASGWLLWNPSNIYTKAALLEI